MFVKCIHVVQICAVLYFVTRGFLFYEIKRDGITSLHGINTLISWAIMRYGYRGLYYRNDDIFSIYRAALIVAVHVANAMHHVLHQVFAHCDICHS